MSFLRSQATYSSQQRLSHQFHGQFLSRLIVLEVSQIDTVVNNPVLACCTYSAIQRKLGHVFTHGYKGIGDFCCQTLATKQNPASKRPTVYFFYSTVIGVQYNRYPGALSRQTTQDARLGNMGVDDIVTSLADVLVDGGKGCYICDWIRGSLQCSHVMGLNAPLAGFLPQTSLFRFAAAGQDFHGIALWDQSCSNIQYMARSPTTDQPREDM